MIDAGTFNAPNWVDLTTPDIDDATRFYRELFGWSMERSVTPMGEYFIGAVDGHQVAGMMGQGSELRGMPAVWTTFFFVADVEHVLAAAAAAGGSVLQPALDIPDGRVAVVADPTGAMLGLISGPRPQGTYLAQKSGAVCWIELLTRDPTTAEGFYATVFGWKADTTETAGTVYTTFKLDDENVAGMMMMPATVPAEAPAHWAVYFSVASCKATERRAMELGGAVLYPTTPVGIGSFAVLADPQGAPFHVMESNQ